MQTRPKDRTTQTTHHPHILQKMLTAAPRVRLTVNILLVHIFPTTTSTNRQILVSDQMESKTQLLKSPDTIFDSATTWSWCDYYKEQPNIPFTAREAVILKINFLESSKMVTLNLH